MKERFGYNIKSNRRLKIWAFVSGLFIIFIFANSLKSGETSSQQSGFVLNIAKNIFGFISNLGVSENDVHFFIRKVAHFTEFAILGILLINLKRSAEKDGRKLYIFINLFIGLAVGVTDEFIQYFVPGRASMVTDVVIDFSGFLFGTLIFVIIFKLLDKRKIALESSETTNFL